MVAGGVLSLPCMGTLAQPSHCGQSSAPDVPVQGLRWHREGVDTPAHNLRKLFMQRWVPQYSSSFQEVASLHVCSLKWILLHVLALLKLTGRRCWTIMLHVFCSLFFIKKKKKNWRELLREEKKCFSWPKNTLNKYIQNLSREDWACENPLQNSYALRCYCSNEF